MTPRASTGPCGGRSAKAGSIDVAATACLKGDETIAAASPTHKNTSSRIVGMRGFILVGSKRVLSLRKLLFRKMHQFRQIEQYFCYELNRYILSIE
jgi:hypothetical protein